MTNIPDGRELLAKLALAIEAGQCGDLWDMIGISEIEHAGLPALLRSLAFPKNRDQLLAGLIDDAIAVLHLEAIVESVFDGPTNWPVKVIIDTGASETIDTSRNVHYSAIHRLSDLAPKQAAPSREELVEAMASRFKAIVEQGAGMSFAETGIYLPVKSFEGYADAILTRLAVKPVNDVAQRPRAFLAWAVQTYGPLELDRHERVLQFLEETLEVVHAEGTDRNAVDLLTTKVWRKPPFRDELPREIGQAMALLEMYAESIGVSADREASKEFERIQGVPNEELLQRNAVKQSWRAAALRARENGSDSDLQISHQGPECQSCAAPARDRGQPSLELCERSAERY